MIQPGPWEIHYFWGMDTILYRIAAFAMAAASALAGNLHAQDTGEITSPDCDVEPGHRYAVTEFSVNFMREKPDFPEELGNQLLMGTPVEITGSEGYWKKVTSPEPYTAWCVETGVVEMTEEQIEEYIAAPKYIVTADYSHVFKEPSEKSERISDLVAGDLLRRVCRQDGRTAVKKGFAKVMLPSGTVGYVKRHDLAGFESWAGSRKATAESIISEAMRYLGVPYLWGGTSIKGVDCSGFTRMVWFMNGVLLPRNASAQSRTGIRIPYPDCGKAEVSAERMRLYLEKLMPGDLLFFGKDSRASHVGIYIGDGRFIHASQKVRISSLVPGLPDYYSLSFRLLWACRVTGQEDKGSGVTSMLMSPAYFPQDKN